MYCKYCVEEKKFNPKLDNNFVTGVNDLKKQLVDRHAGVTSHQLAEENFFERRANKEIEKKVPKNTSEYIRSIMRSLIWLISEDIAMSKLPSVLKLLSQQKCPPLIDIHENFPYCSSTSIRELTACISEAYEVKQFEQITKSDYLSLLMDESTDKTNEKGLMLYIKHIGEYNYLCTTFYCYLSIVDSTAQHT
eukprot:TRINITY_DN4603_c0_g1_i4.p2 TRINITY_DN4603_c0_g1~~TRINITY_DN4603_c0_g1_i4.p2  ORF type:complete len:192 (+),score=5.89 TRINITY_DN4603_c0_g1_i4:676-1251(+)